MVYKLVVNLDDVDLNLLFDRFMQKDIDVYLHNEEILLYVPCNKEVSISMIMKKMKIRNFFVKEITEKPRREDTNPSSIWIYNKIQTEENRKFEEAHQDELRQMQENIRCMEDYIYSSQKNIKEVENGSVETRDGGEAEARSPQENSDRAE